MYKIQLSYTRDNTTGLPVIIEENHYYAFGLKHTNYNIAIRQQYQKKRPFRRFQASKD